MIRDHDAEDAGFELGLNQFSDMSPEEFENQYFGVSVPVKKRMEKVKTHKLGLAAPEKVLSK